MDWNDALKPLIEKYRGRRHPLEYRNRYQLMVMVLLSAQDSDRHINELAPALFAAFPTMADLAQATEEELIRLLDTVRNFGSKIGYLRKLSALVRTDEAIPSTLPELIQLPGIGRKSANVILRESRLPAEGIIVDLHVIRVAPRLGMAVGEVGDKIEKQLMALLDRTLWDEVGMALSFLGRETCRPTRPHCSECVLQPHCGFSREQPTQEKS